MIAGGAGGDSRDRFARRSTSTSTWISAVASRQFSGGLGEGIRWLRKVAEQGEEASGDFTILSDIEDARTRLGMAYWYGTGVKRDYAEAVKWHLKAAEQGDGLSQKAVAEAYAEGKGVKRDYVQAHKWANLAITTFRRKIQGLTELLS